MQKLHQTSTTCTQLDAVMPLHSRAVQASPVAIIICDEVIAYRSLHCRKQTRFQLLIRCGGSFFCFAHVSQYAWGNLLTANSKITLKMQINPVRTNLPNFIGLCFFILNSLFMIWTLRSHSLVLSSFRNTASRSIVFAFVFVHTNVMWLWMYAKWHRPNWRERKKWNMNFDSSCLHWFHVYELAVCAIRDDIETAVDIIRMNSIHVSASSFDDPSHVVRACEFVFKCTHARATNRIRLRFN